MNARFRSAGRPFVPWPWLPAMAALALVVAVGTPGIRAREVPPTREMALVIDHRAVTDFDRIPPRYVRAASELRFVLRSASIGWNIDIGLDCLANHFPDRRRRPSMCDRDVPAGQVVFDRAFDRRRWRIEPRGNPGWWEKIRDFTARLDAATPGERVDVACFNFNYGDAVPGSTIADQFFERSPNARLGNVATIEALEKAHPQTIVVWWSMALPRRSSPEMQAFNRRMRAYALEHRKVFMDLADIESHHPDGRPCTDSQGQGLEALCPEYTREVHGGHLNAYGSQRAAKALWVLMARLAGWAD